MDCILGMVYCMSRSAIMSRSLGSMLMKSADMSPLEEYSFKRLAITSFPSAVVLLGVPFFRPPVFLPIAMRLKLKAVAKLMKYLRCCNVTSTDH